MARSPIARRWAVSAALLGALLLPPPAADASCQTALCRHQYWLGDRHDEAKVRRALAEDPEDVEAWRRLDRLLQSKASREAEIARYVSRYRWEAPPDLSHLAGEVAAERRRIAERIARLETDDPQAWCRYAASLSDPAERLAALERRFAERPDEPEVAACLAFELADQGRREEGERLLRALFAERPGLVVAEALVAFVPEADLEGAVAVLAELAARRPDDFEAQHHLLHYLRYSDRDGRFDELARSVAQRLLAGRLSGDEHRRLCRAIGERLGAVREDCWERLYQASFAEEDPEEAADRRASALEAMIRLAYGRRDWPRLESLLPRVPAEDLPMTWSQIVGFTRRESCPQFVAAFDRGIAAADEHRARLLVRTLRDCGEEERARTLVAAAGLRRADGSDATTTPDVEVLRRSASRGEGLPHRRVLERLGDEATPSLRRDLELWAREEPEDVRPWLGLAAVHERAGDADAALGALAAAAAARPDDLDLQVALGAAALRLDRPQTVRTVARRLRRDAAANPRHRAEADYLLGRLARRDGRWEEAAELLAGYFLPRLEFAGCPMAACDWALVLHLAQSGDAERLAGYLAARNAALATYLDRQPPGDLVVLCDGQGGPGCPDHGSLDVSDLPDELPDPEPLFPDDELLALSWELREVD